MCLEHLFLNKSQNIAFKLDDQIDSVIPFLDRANIFSGKAAASQTAIAKQLNKTLKSGLDCIDDTAFGKTNAIDPKTGEVILNKESFNKLKDDFLKQGMSEEEAIKEEGTNKYVKKNYEFFGFNYENT